MIQLTKRYKEIKELTEKIMRGEHFIKPQKHGTHFQRWCYAYEIAKQIITNKNK